MLPEFLLADNERETPDMFYVVHTSEPKFIAQFDSEDFQKRLSVTWIDQKPSPDEVMKLMRRAEEFFESNFPDIEEDL